MKTYIAIFAGAMLSTVFAAGGPSVARNTNNMACAGHTCCRPPQAKGAATADPAVEERFRMKFGRSTPAEEARQKAEQEVYAKNMLSCEKQGCGRDHEKAVATANTGVQNDPAAEERFRMKFGRNTSAEELRLAVIRR